MREVRERAAARRERGPTAPEDVEREVVSRLRTSAEQAKIDPRLVKRLLHPSHDWNIDPDYLVRTPRSGIVGRLVLGAKRAVRPFVRLYTDHLFARQAQINLHVFYVLRNAVREIVRLELEVARLKREAGSSERRELRAKPRE